MERVVSFDFVKECSKTLKKKFKGIQASSYGFCCSGDYNTFKNFTNDNDFICAKIFKGGLNNQFHNNKFDMFHELYYMWRTTEFKIHDILNVMQEVADKYDYTVIAPKSIEECITVVAERRVA